jgi:hypothetical protein
MPKAQAPLAGYSGTPLIKKLGIKPGMRAAFVRAPSTFERSLGPLPERLEARTRGELDFAILFAANFGELRKDFPRLMKRLAAAGSLWVSWAKKASGRQTDLDENLVRDFGLAEGLVDVKVCAVDEIWSGLKFVRRLKDR